MERVVELPSIKESTREYEEMEARIKSVFRRELYQPILRLLQVPERLLRNAKHAPGLAEALAKGTLTYSNGSFRGKFNASITRELKELGAIWDKATSSFSLPRSKLPVSVRAAISTADVRQKERLKRIDKHLSQISPAKIADSVKTSDLFVRAAEKINILIAKSLKGRALVPTLSAKEKEKIAEEWQNNMDLWITGFTEEEIIRLRKDIAANVSTGNRQEAIVQSLQRSYGITERKAKFLARQETNLLMAKFKETRYTSANVKEYRWGCVAGSKNHPVRPSHKVLENKIFRWDTPPITSSQGEPTRRNNPGQDYNCRCFARPIIRF